MKCRTPDCYNDRAHPDEPNSICIQCRDRQLKLNAHDHDDEPMQQTWEAACRAGRIAVRKVSSGHAK